MTGCEVKLIDWNLMIEKLIDEDGVFLDNLSQMSTDLERTSFCYKNSKILSAVKDWKLSAEKFMKHEVEQKSESASLVFKQKGNESFAKKCYCDALEFYTKAIVFSPQLDNCETNEKLAILFSNRSATLFYMRKYEDCLDEINNALRLSTANNLKFKLLARRSKCYFNMGKYQECSEDVEKVLCCQSEGFQDLKDDYVDRVVRESQDLLLQVDQNLGNDRAKETLKESERLDEMPSVSFSKNQKIDCMTSAMDTNYTLSKGRHLIANRDLKIGDILFVEKPFAAVLLPNFNETNCHHCFEPIKITFPCRNCISVRYCSYKCSKDSFEEYHAIECPWITILYRTGILHLALRIILKAGLKFLIENRELLPTFENETDFSNFSDARPFHSYFGVYSLVTNSQWVASKDLFYYSVSAALLTILLEKNISSVSAEENSKLFIGSLILRHIQQLICNANAVTGIKSHGGDLIVENQVQERIATAIYPAASLMNHSCEPNIICSYYGDTLILRAASNINIHDEIFNCYGPHFLKMSKLERLEALKQQYYFTCKCRHCVNDIEKNIFSRAFKCDTCSGPVMENKKCLECGRISEDLTLDKKFNESLIFFASAQASFEKNKTKEALELIEKCLEMQTGLYKYHSHLLCSMDLAAKILAEMGIYDKCATLLRQTIVATEEIYGSCSIELAHELQKMTDVLLNQINETQFQTQNVNCFQLCNEALEYSKKGLEIFASLYGSEHDSFKQLANKYKHFSMVELVLQKCAKH